MYTNKAYIIKTKTNLHVGSDGTNFGIVDNEVQRDTITNLPVINASSLKGAIKDHFDESIENDTEVSQQFLKLFGDGENQGLIKYIDARLLFLPLRSNKKPFYHTTSIANLEAMKEFLDDMGIKIDIDTLEEQEKSVVIGNEKTIVEDVECDSLQIDISNLQALFGIQNLAIFTDEDFNEAVSNLPVIARNNLEEGKENLWYEEVVPRESIFYTVLNYYNNFNDTGADNRGKTDKTVFDRQIKKFDEKLTSEHIQIGANASIGYGICNFTLVGASDE